MKNVSSINNQLIKDLSPINNQLIKSVSPINNQLIKSVSPINNKEEHYKDNDISHKENGISHKENDISHKDNGISHKRKNSLLQKYQLSNNVNKKCKVSFFCINENINISILLEKEEQQSKAFNKIINFLKKKNPYLKDSIKLLINKYFS